MNKFLKIPPEEKVKYSLQYMEDKHIKFVMEFCGGEVKRSADLLGIERRTLHRKLLAKPHLRPEKVAHEKV